MKLSPRDAPGYFRRPDPTRPGLLIFGADAMRVALRRQEVVAAIIGPEGEAEMRCTRMTGADLRRDPAAAGDAMRATGFFPGPRAVVVEEAGDGLADPIAAALNDWRPGDAHLVVTAGALAARSKLRKAVETHPRAYAVGIYDDPPSREEIETRLREAGLTRIDDAALAELFALARSLDPGDFHQTVERIALYKHGDATPLSPAEVTLLAPATSDAALDDVLNAVADARDAEVGPVLARLRAQGTTAVSLAIGATRHFRALHTVASDPGGASAGIARLRPPVFGPRRDRMQRQAQRWGVRRLEQALGLLIETDLALRSASPAPDMAVVERMLIRLARLGAR